MKRRTGHGHASCHHGEVLQGVFRDARGLPVPGLVTLPMHEPCTRAEFVPRPEAQPEDLEVSPAGRTKALRAAALAMEECTSQAGVRPCGGMLTLSGGIPVGLGMGSSSSDVIATVRAVADSCGVRLSPSRVARLAVRAEKASDPLMLSGRPVLFAQREGRVLEVLGPALPPAVVVGCTLAGGRPVDTLALPPRRVRHADLHLYERLRRLLRRAVARGDTALLGLVCTQSATLGQQGLHHAQLGDLLDVASRCGAAGVQVAHSGNVAGLLFDPSSPGLDHRLRHCRHALELHGIPVSRTFTTHPTDERHFCGHAHGGSDRPARPHTAGRRAGLPAL